MQNLHWQLTGKQSLEAHFWWQGSGREIPPTTTQNRSKAGQSDKILRTALEWKWLGNMAVVTAKTAFFEEEIDYQDSLSGVFEVTKFHSSIGEVEAQYQAGRHGSILLGINHSATKGFAAAYHGKQSQQQTAFFAGSRFAKGEWKAQLDARAELLDGRWLPTTPSLGLEWAPHPQLAIKGKLARNYRYPTLNDRYWQPGGNPELLPEQGWSEEISVLPILIYNEKWKLDYQFTAFNRTIKNWILWAVQPGEFYYSPGNITEVWSRGIEQRLHFSAPVASHVLKLNLGYDFVRSTSLKDVALPTIKAGEQLIYTPEHQAFGSIDYGLAQWHFSYQHRYTGQVATQTEALEDYHVGSFYLEKTIPFQPMTARVFIQIDNVWNANYRVVERRPMPGRNFRVGLRMDFEKLKSSTIF
jgi:iron complex outermembrane receptor protein